MAILSKRVRPAEHGFTRYTSSYTDISSLSLGCRDIGNVKIDCCFLGSKSVWGELSDQAASLMYIDLTFHQPQDCKLVNATITLTMEYEKSSRPSPHCLGPRVTDFFGPKEVNGEKHEQHITKKFQFKPNIGAMGATFGGIGGDRTSEYSSSSRWKFRGQRWPVNNKEPSRDDRTGAYRQVEWVLEESSLNDQAFHSGQMHTALVIEHDQLPFNMEVQIKGKLRRSLKKLKFPPSIFPAKKMTSISPKSGSKTPLDALAVNLDRVMTEKNLRAVPGKVPSHSSCQEHRWLIVCIRNIKIWAASERTCDQICQGNRWTPSSGCSERKSGIQSESSQSYRYRQGPLHGHIALRQQRKGQ